jgi:hypothetical protein
LRSCRGPSRKDADGMKRKIFFIQTGKFSASPKYVDFIAGAE